MKHLTEQINNIFEENNFNDEDIKNKILKFIEEFPQIIDEKNVEDDFIEGLENHIGRKLTYDEIEDLHSSGEINDTIEAMCDEINNRILDYASENLI